jgi:hypothetical protein
MPDASFASAEATTRYLKLAKLTSQHANVSIGQGQTENEFASGADLLPVNPQVRTYPGALANIRSAPIR